jgi:hypothetical protein
MSRDVAPIPAFVVERDPLMRTVNHAAAIRSTTFVAGPAGLHHVPKSIDKFEVVIRGHARAAVRMLIRADDLDEALDYAEQGSTTELDHLASEPVATGKQRQVESVCPAAADAVVSTEPFAPRGSENMDAVLLWRALAANGEHEHCIEFFGEMITRERIVSEAENPTNTDPDDSDYFYIPKVYWTFSDDEADGECLNGR